MGLDRRLSGGGGCNLGVLGKGEQSFKDEESPAEGERGGQPIGQESAIEERHCRRHHRPRALRIAQVCK